MMKTYRFDFSFVISVYNVIEYIEEALNSLLNQQYDIERIQFVLVDDGSTDGSAEYCDRFYEAHPNNTVVVHKENGGLSSARMAGIEKVEGKYVTFFDPDDILSPDTLKLVFSFFEEHEKETDVVAIPIYFFGDIHGPHPLNNKFALGSRVIDLINPENAEFGQMSVATAFFTREAVTMMDFNTEIVTAEDAIELVKILTEKKTLGVVAGARYEYRKRKTSNVGTARYKKGWYNTYLKCFSEWSIHYCLNKLGYVPRFIQNTVLYDLQWKIRQAHVDMEVLTEQEAEEYRTKLFNLVKYFDDDIIFWQKHLNVEQKLFLLWQKYNRIPEIVVSPENNEPCFGYNGNAFYQVNNVVSYVNFIDIGKEYIEIKGSVMTFNIALGNPKICVKIGDRYIDTNAGTYKDIVYSVDIPIAERKGFIARIPVDYIKDKESICVVSKYDGFSIEHKRIILGKYAPLSRQCKYYVKNGIMLHLSHNCILAEKTNGAAVMLEEIKYLKRLITSPKRKARRAALVRCMYHLIKPFAPKNIWLITDKADRADDNGEAFFKFLIEQKKSECHPVFAIGKSSPDYQRMKKIGPVIPYMSWQHKLVHLLAKHTVSAYSHNEITSPFLKNSPYYRDLLANNKVVFLQHGIIKDDLSRGLNKQHKNFALFVTSTEREREAVLNDNYGYGEQEIILTGLPRYDRLYNNPQKKITIMPTWRRALFGSYDPKTSRWLLLPGFEDSQFYQFYNGLLTSKELIDYAEQKGYTIQLLIHPVLFPYLSHFQLDSRVVVLDSSACYRDVFAESSLITTDFSSVAFDFAYLRKPVIYTQFDGNHYAEGYFDYERDGFGEVEHDLEGTIARIKEYIANDCKAKDKYLERIDRFFAFHDRNNCQRVFEHIIELDKRNE